MLERPMLVAVVLAALAGCSGRSGLSPEAERGRQAYLAHCSSCHSADPAQNGPLGPAVEGSSRELLEARVLRGVYPPGYTPKRPERGHAADAPPGGQSRRPGGVPALTTRPRTHDGPGATAPGPITSDRGRGAGWLAPHRLEPDVVDRRRG